MGGYSQAAAAVGGNSLAAGGYNLEPGREGRRHRQEGKLHISYRDSDCHSMSRGETERHGLTRSVGARFIIRRWCRSGPANERLFISHLQALLTRLGTFPYD